MDYFHANNALSTGDISDLITRFQNEQDDESKSLYETILVTYGKSLILIQN